MEESPSSTDTFKTEIARLAGQLIQIACDLDWLTRGTAIDQSGIVEAKKHVDDLHIIAGRLSELAS